MRSRIPHVAQYAATIKCVLNMTLVLVILFLSNIKEHAPPLAGAGVETGMEVHTTGGAVDKAASGGCCASSCSPLFLLPVLGIVEDLVSLQTDNHALALPMVPVMA